MEGKTFELLEEMYVEFSEFRKETREELQGLKNDIIRIENRHGKKLDAPVSYTHLIRTSSLRRLIVQPERPSCVL